jgi:hypothetical protein
VVIDTASSGIAAIISPSADEPAIATACSRLHPFPAARRSSPGTSPQCLAAPARRQWITGVTEHTFFPPAERVLENRLVIRRCRPQGRGRLLAKERTPLTLASDPQLDLDFTLNAGLRAYIQAVGVAIGSGWEACSLDFDAPRGAYIALDRRLAAHPGCDLALLWHERRGWSAVVETPSGEDLTVARLGGPVVTEPRAVAKFLADVRAGRVPSPPTVAAGTTVELAAALTAYLREPVL